MISLDTKVDTSRKSHEELMIEQLKGEIDKLNGELSCVKSDKEMLKDTIVRMSMKLVGVTN